MSCLHLWASVGVRKNARHEPIFGFDPSPNLSSQFSAVTGLSEVRVCNQVTVCSSFWKSYTTLVIKQHFYFGHQKTLHGSKLHITTCCVERMWRSLHFPWLLLGSSAEKQRLTLLFLLLVCDYCLWRAFQVKSTSFMVPFPSLSCLEILEVSVILVPVLCNSHLLRL